MSLTDAEIRGTELYKITLSGYALSAYFTNYSKPIVYGGNTYIPIPIKRNDISYHSNLQVDRVDITIGIVDVTLGTETLTIPTIVKRGFLRNAQIFIYLVDRATNPATLLETRFVGYVTGNISSDGGSITLSCGSLLDKLSEKLPRQTYSDSCDHSIYDANCGLDEDDFKENGTITVGSTTTTIIASVFAFSNQPEGYWEKGYTVFTSGDNNGVEGSIKRHYDGYVTVMLPFPYTPAVGDTFYALPGCGGQATICESIFNNYANSLIFEDIPDPSVIYG